MPCLWMPVAFSYIEFSTELNLWKWTHCLVTRCFKFVGNLLNLLHADLVLTCRQLPGMSMLVMLLLLSSWNGGKRFCKFG